VLYFARRMWSELLSLPGPPLEIEVNRAMRSKNRLAANLIFAVLLTFALAAAIVPTQARAQKFKVLHTFHGKDGANPFGLLVRDAFGNLYGTTANGGDGKGLCTSFFYGCGTAFKLAPTGKELWVHSFNLTNGEGPLAGMTRDPSGNLYGTTYLGGDTKCYQYGCGTVFELDKAGKMERVLHKFTGGADGMFPEPLLARDAAGNLYGTATSPLGKIFKIDTAGKLTVLYTFTGGSDGCVPYPGVILDATGNLYGTTAAGGSGFCDSGDGVVFELDTSGSLIVLHTFGGGDGANPGSALVFDPAGNLYGTTLNGGTGCGGVGCGTVFKLSPNGDGAWTESVLHSFCSLSGCVDGNSVGRGPLAVDAAGNLYGTAYFGGSHPCSGGGCGLVYKVDASGHETVLYNFTGGKDGAFPFPGVVMDKSGNLYGVAVGYGDSSCPDGKGVGGCGVVFKLTP
jgi:uncharacterized repeat protein (TIGR03803 family)